MATITDARSGASYAPPASPPAASLADDLGEAADRLRRITVEVRSAGGGAGSGVVWRQDGLVVTNAHVVRGSRAGVTLADGRTLDARLLARDDRLDLAALSIPAVGLAAALVGDPEALRPGEMVLALGNPLGVVGALAVGIVHAAPTERGRPGRGPRWILADVRLAPGNSGGPLADARGRVLGVNAMIVNGMGLAIPANVVERFVRAHVVAYGVSR